LPVAFIDAVHDRHGVNSGGLAHFAAVAFAMTNSTQACSCGTCASSCASRRFPLDRWSSTSSSARPGEQAGWLVVEQGVADLCRDDPERITSVGRRT
jgi:hypothetical protein